MGFSGRVSIAQYPSPTAEWRTRGRDIPFISQRGLESSLAKKPDPFPHQQGSIGAVSCWSLGVARLLLAAACFLTTIATPALADKPKAARTNKPNLLVVIADDLGYADVGIHGNSEIPTPHIDSIARGGVRLSCGYVSGPYCSPTRAGLLTGRYQQRFGHEFNPPGPNVTNRIGSGLPVTEVTLPDRLRTAGYATGLVGKWHLGSGDPFRPLKRGFDEFFGFLGPAHSYTNLGTEGPNPVYRGNTPVVETEYLTDAFTREAIGFLDRHRAEPFYLQVAFNAVHSPLDAAPRHLARFAHIHDEKRRNFASLYAAFDEGVGRILDTLKRLGLEENTVVFFFSDNGGPTNDNTSRNTPFRGFKGQTWEGGIHIPYFVRWPGQLPEGKVYDKPVIQLDIHATALALAGIQIDPKWKLDGVNLVPYLKGQTFGQPHSELYWRFGDQMAIRAGDWKLVKAQEGESNMRGIRPGPIALQEAQLFDLSKDPSESVNLAAKYPSKTRKLLGLWQRWNSSLPEPSWKPGVAPRGTGSETNRPPSASAQSAPLARIAD